MKIKLLLFSLLFCNAIFAQQNRFAGIWEGKIDVGIKLRIVFHFRDSAGSIITTMDSPDQSAFGIPTDNTDVHGDSIFTSISKLQVYIAAALTSDTTISGTFRQSVSIPLELKKVSKLSAIQKPQTPVGPFPYNSEDVSYTGGGKDVIISGTITSPKEDAGRRYIKAPAYPALILVTGSGPQNRDEEILGHKPFAVIADFLTRKGFIVLRVDDRGIGKSTGNYSTATSADFGKDVRAGINFLKKRKDVDTSRIGILGHSEGGMIAPMVAAESRDIDFIILLAGPGIKPVDLMTEQNLAIFNSIGISKSAQQAYAPLYKSISLAIAQAKDTASSVKAAHTVLNKWLKGKDSSVLNELHILTKTQQDEYVKSMSATISTPWFRYFVLYDPTPVLRKVNTKVLAINGDKDLQVLSHSNLAGIEAALKKTSSDYEIHEMKGLNHLFQKCKLCTIKEYGDLEETISPSVLDLIWNWLKRKVL